MNNNQLLPFERNRYYAGKILTSTDFVAEQLYMNNKRRFLNHIMYGSGIVCGLNVFNLDDVSILVESGVAIDESGREIVVDSTMVKKISTIEGYDNIKGDRAKLFLKYKEEEVHPVYCSDIGTKENEYECNRIDEGYELYLQEIEQNEEQAFALTEEFLTKEKILDNEDYQIYASIPTSVSKGEAVKMLFTIHKKSQEKKTLHFEAKLQLPAFSDETGKRELDVELQDIQLKCGETLQKEYWMNTELTDAAETNIIAKKENIHISIGGYEIEVNHDLNFKILLVDVSPYNLAASEVGKVNLEAEKLMPKTMSVCLAEIRFIRTEASCLIGSIIEQGQKKYIITPGKTHQRNEYLSYFRTRQQQTGVSYAHGEEEQQVSSKMAESPSFMTSGRIEIPLDVNMKKGDVCFSEEITHGLGKGNVYVEVGVEYFDNSAYSDNNRRNTIYGNPDLFSQPECMEVETAVKVLNDRGSFQIAAKLLGEQKSIVLQLNWVAMKFTSMKDAAEMQEEDNRAIVPETPTARLKSKESYFFNMNFQNMKPCRLTYELTESGSGEIGADGVYIAPAKEGVYEIYVYCTDMPKIFTYVYAIVSK